MYIFESQIPENKSILFALTYIQGIGKPYSILICKTLGFSTNLKVSKLTKEQINKLITTIESLNIELASDLKKFKILATKKLISIKSYKGQRKIQGLPVRGQRTHTNAKTSRKKRI